MGKKRIGNMLLEQLPHLVLFALIAAVFLYIGLGYWQKWTWTGLVRTDPGTKLLWDWLELLLIPAGIGVGVWWLNRRTQNREFLIGMRADLVKAYIEVKYIHRNLRAFDIHKDGTQEWARLDEYAKLMEVMNEAQLQFEIYWEIVNGDRKRFPQSGPLKEELKHIEEYLKAIWQEVVTKRPNFLGQVEAPLKHFKRLEILVADREKGDQHDKSLNLPFYNSLSLIDGRNLTIEIFG